MRKFFKKYWIAIIAFLMIAGIVALLLTRAGEPTPSPTPSPNPFKIENTYPKPGSYEVVIPNLAIEFIFTKNVDLAKTAIDISPTSEIDISYGDTEKSVVVRPDIEWQMDTSYTFRVTAESKDGKRLEETFEYQIEFTPLEQSGLEEN